MPDSECLVIEVRVGKVMAGKLNTYGIVYDSAAYLTLLQRLAVDTSCSRRVDALALPIYSCIRYKT